MVRDLRKQKKKRKKNLDINKNTTRKFKKKNTMVQLNLQRWVNEKPEESKILDFEQNGLKTLFN